MRRKRADLETLDRPTVLAAVRLDWTELARAPPALQGDKELVLAALAQSGNALHYASLDLCGDAAFMLESVAVHGEALRYAAGEVGASLFLTNEFARPATLPPLPAPSTSEPLSYFVH